MSDEGPAQSSSTPSTWHETLVDVFKDNDVRLAAYVPDTVLTPLIDAVHVEPSFTAFVATREEEAVGVACGAWMGGSLSVVMMQTSGFGTLGNALASLVVPYQIPLIMVVSERGTLGEFNLGQTLVWRTMRPLLDTLGIEHHTITRLDEMDFVVNRSIKQALATRVPIALILSPLLTGGKAVKRKEVSS